MSLKASAEFVIHVDGFRNIDLFHQGLYHVRFSIYYEKNDQVSYSIEMHNLITRYVIKKKQRIYAHPYHLRDGLKVDDKKKKTNKNMPCQILDESSIYCTKTFLIKFCDEEAEINELCHFRTEFDAYPEYQSQEFFLEADLMHCDITNMINIEEKKNEDDPYSDFKQVSNFKARITQLHSGIHEYVPVIFDEQHFCLTSINVYSLLMDFKFRNNPNDIVITTKQIEKDPKSKDNNKGKKLENEAPLAKTFIEFLELTTQFQNDDLDVFYSFFIRGLQRTFERLAKYFQQVLNLSIIDKPKEDLSRFTKEASLLEKELKPQKFNNSNISNIPNDNQLDSTDEESKSEISSISEDIQEFQKKFSFFKFPGTKFSQNINGLTHEEISKVLLTEINIISGKSFQLWHLLLELILVSPKSTAEYHKREYHKQVRERYGESIFQHVYKINDFVLSYEPKIGENHKQIATARRGNIYYKNIEFFNNIEDLSMFPKPEFHPILFEEICIKDTADMSLNPKLLDNLEISNTGKKFKYKKLANPYNSDKIKIIIQQQNSGLHLIVLVHGFQGNSYDMRLIKNNLSYLYPDSLFLSSAANEDNTECEIEVMGKRLADEVKGFIKEFCTGNSLARLSFIGHSLGGLIIRASLEHLKEFDKKMHLYMSLSSPHLGYMYNSSKIINAGMWILKKWKKSTSLTQLSMTDTEELEDAYLFKLSQKTGLEWFKHIALVSSYQDQYAPFDSARIQIGHKVQNDAKGRVFVKMAKNILSNVKAESIYRIDVNFKLPQKNIDTMIGRAAHIQFLESTVFMRMIAYRYVNFFSQKKPKKKPDIFKY